MGSMQIPNRVAYAIWIAFAVAIVVGGWESGLPWLGLDTGMQSGCAAHLKEIGAEVLTYARNSGGRFPALETWNDLVKKKWKLRCSTRIGESAYAMNAKLKGLTIKDVKHPDKTVMLFESIPGRNLAGGLELLPKPPRHPGGYSVAFVDGRVRMVREQEMGQLIWDPRK